MNKTTPFNFTFRWSLLCTLVIITPGLAQSVSPLPTTTTIFLPTILTKAD